MKKIETEVEMDTWKGQKISRYCDVWIIGHKSTEK